MYDHQKIERSGRCLKEVRAGRGKGTNDELFVEVSEVLVLSDESCFSSLEEGEFVISGD